MSGGGISLLNLHSALVDESITYLAALETRLPPTPRTGWFGRGYRGRRQLHAIPAERLGHFDLHAELIAPPTLDSAVASLDMALILGEPEAGLTNWLAQFAHNVATGSREALEGCHALPEDICMPVHLRVSELAAALAPDKDGALQEMLARAGVPAPELQIHPPAKRVGAALLLALYRTDDIMFPGRIGGLLWSKLWPDEHAPGQESALIVLDRWDEVTPQEQDDLDRYLAEFVAQTAARIFIGSRYTPDRSPTFLSAFNSARRQVLCLWPYELPVPTPLPGFAIWRTPRDLEEFRRITSLRRLGRRSLITLRPPSRRELALGCVVVGLCGYLIWQSWPLGLRIIEPREDDQVCASATVTVAVPAHATQVWVVVHPENHPGHWVQPECQPVEGRCAITANFGREGLDFGLWFEIRAVADPSARLEVDQIFSTWPPARLTSKPRKVQRRKDC